MFYVYSRRPSEGGWALTAALGGIRLRRFDGMNFWKKKRPIKFNAGDVLISWGDPVPEVPGIHILNGAKVPSKYEVALLLQQDGIPTIPVFKRKQDALYYAGNASQVLGRRNDHVGGNDLLTPTENPDFWTVKLPIMKEFRIHSFNQKCIRAGEKKLREGFSLSDADIAQSGGTLQRASAWVRSFDGGWRIVYDDFKSIKDMRDIAHKAVAALKLNFGAVDIAQLKDGSYLVLEVNRAPGIEGGSLEKYVAHIKEWANEVGRVSEGSAAGGERVRDGRAAIVVPYNKPAEPAAPAAPRAAADGYGFRVFPEQPIAAAYVNAAEGGGEAIAVDLEGVYEQGAAPEDGGVEVAQPAAPPDPQQVGGGVRAGLLAAPVPDANGLDAYFEYIRARQRARERERELELGARNNARFMARPAAQARPNRNR